VPLNFELCHVKYYSSLQNGFVLMVHTPQSTLYFWSVDFQENHSPDPAGGGYSAPPDPLAGFKGPTSNEREGRGGEGKRGEGGGGRKGGEELYRSTNYF